MNPYKYWSIIVYDSLHDSSHLWCPVEVAGVTGGLTGHDPMSNEGRVLLDGHSVISNSIRT